MIEQDILDRIDKDFEVLDALEAKKILLNIHRESIGYYSYSTICRSIVFLANGSVDKIINELLPILNADPRDIIDMAEFKAKGPGHNFRIPFPEIDNFFDKLYEKPEEDPPAEIFWDIHDKPK